MNALGLFWSPGDPAEDLGPRLKDALAAWDGTPYASGQSCPGPRGGVDCVRFVCSVLDELFPAEREPVRTLPPDAAMHDRLGAIKTCRALRKRYAHITVRNGVCIPGDAVVIGKLSGGPGHVMLVGFQKNTLWHAVAPRVCFTGWSLPRTHKLLRVYRMRSA